MNRKYANILILSLIINIILIGILGKLYYPKIKAKLSKNISDNYPINYNIEKSIYDSLSINKNDIVFYGDSLTNYGQWNELFNDKKVINRGIVGDDTTRLFNRIDEIKQSSKVFIMVGINDLVEGKSTESVIENYKKIINTIINKSPNTEIYIESILPINLEKYKINYSQYKIVNVKDISYINIELNKIAEQNNATYIDIYSLLNNNDILLDEYTIDGIHLNGQGYLVWKQVIEKYINQ